MFLRYMQALCYIIHRYLRLQAVGIWVIPTLFGTVVCSLAALHLSQSVDHIEPGTIELEDPCALLFGKQTAPE